MKYVVETTEGNYDIELPDWVKTLDQLELYQGLQRQVFLRRLVDKFSPLKEEAK